MAGGRQAVTWGWVFLFGVAYFALAEAGFWLSEPVQGGSLTTIWPPSGLYVAAIFLVRRRAGWFVLTALVVYLIDVVLIHHRHFSTSLAVFLADTGEAAVGAWGLYSVCGRRVELTRLRDVLALVGFAAIAAPAMAAGLGTPVAIVESAESFGRLWSTWWVVDSLGVLLVAPVILSWPNHLWPALRRCPPTRALEYAVLLAGLTLLTAVTLKAQPGRLLAVPFPTLPFLVWAALRFGPLGTSVAFVVLSLSTFWHATWGPGSTLSRADDLLQVELFLCIVVISFLILAGVTAERRTVSDNLNRSQALLRAMHRAQAEFIGERNLPAVLERLLDDARQLTGSLLGFVGELPRDAADDPSVRLIAARGAGAPAVRSASISQDAAAPAIEPELRDLIEHVARTGRPGVASDLCTRASSADIEPVLADYIALPCHYGGRVVGILGLAFQPGEYDPTLERLIPPLLVTCGHLIDSNWQHTRRRQAEQGLAQSERELADFFEYAPVGLYWIGPDGRILRANRAGLALLGYSREEFLGRPLAEFHVEPGVVQTMLSRMRAGEAFENVAVALRAQDGSLRQVQISANAFRQGDKIVHTRCSVRDVTELKRLEEQSVQMQKLDAIGRLAGGIAHDFNNLLTVINGYADLLVDGLPAEHPQRPLASEIERAGEKAADLTRQLLAFSRRQLLHFRIVDVNEVVREMEGMLRRLLGDDVLLTVQLDSQSVLVRADQGQLQQVLLNLAVNARDAMSAGGRLLIRTGSSKLPADSNTPVQPQADRYSLIEVSDTGCGMNETIRSRIFEPFFTTKEIGRGTGLGLATVYGIVKQSDGEIVVDSAPGAGSTFRIFLPQQAGPISIPTLASSQRSLGTGEAVLVVEDSDEVRGLVANVLQQHGYNLLVARGPSAALQLLETHSTPIHLLLTDVVMPEMNGKELARRVHARFPRVKILYMSGYPAGLLSGDERGEDRALLRKPFSPEALLDRVRQSLDSKAGTGTSESPESMAS